MSNTQLSDIIADVKRLFEQNKKARIVQIKTEEKIIAKISQLSAHVQYQRPERSGGCLDMEWPE